MKREQDKAQAATEKANNKTQQQNVKKKKKGLSYKEKQEFETILARIDQTEDRLTTIEQEMIEASSDYAKIKELNEEQQQLENQ